MHDKVKRRWHGKGVAISTECPTLKERQDRAEIAWNNAFPGLLDGLRALSELSDGLFCVKFDLSDQSKIPTIVTNLLLSPPRLVHINSQDADVHAERVDADGTRLAVTYYEEDSEALLDSTMRPEAFLETVTGFVSVLHKQQCARGFTPLRPSQNLARNIATTRENT